ncbi:MAG: hypothetical protein EXS17_06680 [Phycisphaerales bacterium]|nr:hypothetical protein [Phycisphaerales bacterium]
MSAFFVDLLPSDAHQALRRRVNFRLVKLGAALALTLTTGGVVKSFVELRNARAEHEVIVSLRERASKIDEQLAQGVSDRAMIRSEIAVDAILRSPVSTSTIIATISHLLPEGSWLESMKVSLEDARLGKTLAASRPAYSIMMNGNAPNAQAVQEFAAQIRKTPPFVAVTVLEQRTAQRAGGGSDQQFVMRARIDPTAANNDASTSVQPWNSTVALDTSASTAEFNR